MYAQSVANWLYYLVKSLFTLVTYYNIIAPSSYKSPDVADGLLALATVISGVEFRLGDRLFLLRLCEVLLRHCTLLSCVLRCLRRI
jgi:hypothetical protein